MYICLAEEIRIVAVVVFILWSKSGIGDGLKWPLEELQFTPQGER